MQRQEVVLLVLCWQAFFLFSHALYNIGAGIGDVTGPVAEVNMMGYANPKQVGSGIHIRLFSRAFIIDDSSSRIVYVSVDGGMISQIVKTEVVNRLKAIYHGVYNETNVILSGTHSHSGAAGFHEYLLYSITSLGFVKSAFDSFVKGIVMSIRQAHDSLQPGHILVNRGELLNTSINRSPTSYLLNSHRERLLYTYDTDKTMTLLKFVADDENNTAIGAISWFAVHGTSMNNTNTLFSGDNKGYASQLFEKEMNPHHTPGKGKFVAAFGQANVGDVSPNTMGPHCLDTGKSCNNPNSTCNGRSEMCIAFGPGKDMFESTKIIGRNQYLKAKELYDTADEELFGPILYIHQFVDMPNTSVLVDKELVKLCKPAMGYSFAAGTTDGPGVFDFTQGTNTSNPFWNLVRDLLKTPTAEQIACHQPKPILLNTGEINFPYPWQPSIVETQLVSIGDKFIIAPVPGEFTTMAGRRLVRGIKKILCTGAICDVVIAGLSNTYSSYISTNEEYIAQRYEAASTIYGPNTLLAYVNQYKKLATFISNKEALPPGPMPPFFVDKLISFLPRVFFDTAPLKKHFGSVLVQPNRHYKKGKPVFVEFVSGHPRNNLKLGETYLAVKWFNETKYTDADWSTRFHWHRNGLISDITGRSVASITWETSKHDVAGTYTICHYGAHKNLLTEKVKNFRGCSRPFKLS